MKFCSKCGRQLMEGEICNCDQQMNQYQQYTTDMYNDNTYNNADSQAYSYTQGYDAQAMAQAGKQMASGALRQIMSLLKSPVSVGKEFVQSGSTAAAIIMISLQGILSGIFALIMCMKVQGFFNQLINLATMYSGDNFSDIMQIKTYLKIPIFKSFIMTALISVVLTLILTAIFMGANAIAGSSLKFTQTLSLVSLRSIMSSGMIILGCLISLFNVYAGIAVFCMGNVAGFILVAVVWSQVSPMTADKQIYLVIAVYIIFTVVFALFIKFCWTIYLPDALKILITQIKSSMKGMGFKEMLWESISDMF